MSIADDMVDGITDQLLGPRYQCADCGKALKENLDYCDDCLDDWSEVEDERGRLDDELERGRMWCP